MAFFVIHISLAIAILIAGCVLLALCEKAGFRSCFVLRLAAHLRLRFVNMASPDDPSGRLAL